MSTFIEKCLEEEKQLKECPHQNLVPLEINVAKQSYDGEYGNKLDWGANIINAHIIRVTKFYCPNCRKVIQIPTTFNKEPL